MLSHSPLLYFHQWPTVAHICYYLPSLAIILGVQCPNSSVIDTGLKVLSSWFALQASNIQQLPLNLNGFLHFCTLLVPVDVSFDGNSLLRWPVDVNTFRLFIIPHKPPFYSSVI